MPADSLQKQVARHVTHPPGTVDPSLVLQPGRAMLPAGRMEDSPTTITKLSVLIPVLNEADISRLCISI